MKRWDMTDSNEDLKWVRGLTRHRTSEWESQNSLMNNKADHPLCCFLHHSELSSLCPPTGEWRPSGQPGVECLWYCHSRLGEGRAGHFHILAQLLPGSDPWSSQLSNTMFWHVFPKKVRQKTTKRSTTDLVKVTYVLWRALSCLIQESYSPVPVFLILHWKLV